jgi:putative methionine-R-sulfoxide reductase with GAF domain
MTDPVVLCDGYTYERRQIELLLEHKNTSPITGEILISKELYPNTTLKNAIEEYFQQMRNIHRQAVRRARSGPTALPSLGVGGGGSDPGENNPLVSSSPGIGSNDFLLRTVDSLMELSLLVNADMSSEELLRSIVDEARELIGGEAASVFLIEGDSLVSVINSTFEEIRIPLSTGIAGWVAKTGESVLIPDAYNDEHFNREIDERTGFRTRNILCVPIKTKKGTVIGVAQLMNKIDVENPNDENNENECFSEGDERFLFVFASQAAAALAGSMASEITTPDGKKFHAGGSGDMRVSGGGSDGGGGNGVSSDGCSEEAIQLLEEALNEWQSNIIALDQMTEGRPLSSLMCFLFEKLNFIGDYDMDAIRVRRFFLTIEFGYGDNPYHNKNHGASVAHMMYALLKLGGIADAVSVGDWFVSGSGRSSLDVVMLSGLIAAAIHDYEHFGLNNDFLIKSNHPRAVLYNDFHVNEHHHSAAAFQVLQRPECYFLSQLETKETREIRKLVIELVLATDMDDDKNIRNEFQSILVEGVTEFVPATRAEAILTLKMALKSADLGHLALSWDSHLHWVESLESEFYLQGDKEASLGMTVSFLMDRSVPDGGVTQNQLGFFEFVAIPLFSSMEQAFPAIQPMVVAVAENAESWNMVNEYYPLTEATEDK